MSIPPIPTPGRTAWAVLPRAAHRVGTRDGGREGARGVMMEAAAENSSQRQRPRNRRPRHIHVKAAAASIDLDQGRGDRRTVQARQTIPDAAIFLVRSPPSIPRPAKMSRNLLRACCMVAEVEVATNWRSGDGCGWTVPMNSAARSSASCRTATRRRRLDGRPVTRCLRPQNRIILMQATARATLSNI